MSLWVAQRLARASAIAAAFFATLSHTACFTPHQIYPQRQTEIVQWHGSDVVAPGMPRLLGSIKNSAIEPNDLISLAFQSSQGCSCETTDENRADQSSGGICASLAAVKAAIAVFGVTSVVRSISATPDGVEVVLRNEVQVRVSEAELAHAFAEFSLGCACTQNDESPLSRPLGDWMRFYLAVAAKHLMKSAPVDCRPAYADVVDHLKTSGFNSRRAFALLGLERHVYAIERCERVYRGHGILWTPAHAMYFFDGGVDRWGRQRFVSGVGWLTGQAMLGADSGYTQLPPLSAKDWFCAG